MLGFAVLTISDRLARWPIGCHQPSAARNLQIHVRPSFCRLNSINVHGLFIATDAVPGADLATA